jgi:hypothetical protein
MIRLPVVLQHLSTVEPKKNYWKEKEEIVPCKKEENQGINIYIEMCGRIS